MIKLFDFLQNQTRAITSAMVTKKIRTEYMKKFRDPKWETFSKCYEDSLKYRLTRRVMEHSHKPWFWEGWDSCSDSSGWSTPRLTRNKVVPLSLPPPPPPPPPPCSEVKQRLSSPSKPPEDRETEGGAGEVAAVDAAPAAGEKTVVINVTDFNDGRVHLLNSQPTENSPPRVKMQRASST